MNLNPIKQVYKFNQEAGLLAKGYDDTKECAYPIEESLEGFDNKVLAAQLGLSEDSSPKDISRAIVSLSIVPDNISDVERLDKHLDTIVFALGSIFKLGLTAQDAMTGLSIVMEANMKKLSEGTDEFGKQMKPIDFVGPEELLQKLLDKRVK